MRGAALKLSLVKYLIWTQAFLILFLSVNATAQELKYINRNHTFDEVVTDQALVFGGHTAGYVLTQWDTIRAEGSAEAYRENFGRFRFDNDNTAWNFVGHTYTGAQVYLYYRARGYKQNSSLYLSFLSSLWFEVFIENYTERPSFQDVFNTPIFGSALGFVMEKGTVEMINSESKWKRAMGRILNPFSYLVDDDEEVSFLPIIGNGGLLGAQLSFYYD